MVPAPLRRASLGVTRTRLLALVCLALLAGGLSWRWATVLHGGDYRYSLGQVGYSDIVNLYVLRDFAAHAFPYIHQPVEYPVLTGLTMWATSYAPGLEGFFLVNGALLALAGMATFYVLSRSVAAGQLGRYALAPGLFLYVGLNWDLISLLALTAGIFAAERRRFGWCGMCIGVGTSYKLYPIFLLPVLTALALRLDRRHTGASHNCLALLGAFGATTAVCNVPLAIVSPAGWSYFLRFQSGRPLDPDAIWSHLSPEPAAAITRAFVAVVVVGIVWVATRVYLNHGAGWKPASLACLLFFLVATRDYSPQYDVWLLPLLAILACPWSLWAVFVVADLTYYVAIFLYLFPGFGWPPVLRNPDLALGIGVWSREIALLLLLAWALRGVVRARNLGVTGDAKPDAFPLAVATLGVLATLTGGVAGVAAGGFWWREIVLALEAGALALGTALAINRYRRHRSNDMLLAAGACLVPYTAVVVFNFAAAGTFLLPGLLLMCVSVVETVITIEPGGGSPRDRLAEASVTAQDAST